MLMLVAPQPRFAADRPICFETSTAPQTSRPSRWSILRRMRGRLHPDTAWATRRDMRRLPHAVVTHRLPLALDGIPSHAERRVAAARLQPVTSAINGIVIAPGEVFSLDRALGGRMHNEVGAHRIATLLHWMALYSPLTVVKRPLCPFDLSSDDGLPWEANSSMVSHRATLIIRNDSPFTFQFMTRVDEDYILGELHSEDPLPHFYEIYPDHGEYITLDDQIFRRNEIWRRVIEKRTGDVVTTELVDKNCARVIYDLADAEVAS